LICVRIWESKPPKPEQIETRIEVGAETSRIGGSLGGDGISKDMQEQGERWIRREKSEGDGGAGGCEARETEICGEVSE
jgi:hypothetical protein